MLLPIQTNNFNLKTIPYFKGNSNIDIPLGTNLIPEGYSMVYFSDFHSNISRLPKIAGLIDYIESKLKNERLFKTCAGDFLFGSSERNSDIIIKILNKLNLSAIVPGNHEFDLKLTSLKELLKKVRFPVLASNLKENNDLPVKDYITTQINNNNFGVIGITTPVDNPKKFKGQMNFIETVFNIQQKVNELTRNGINKIILVSHAGLNNDQQIAKQTRGIDIIISSHDHYNIDGIKQDINLFKSNSNEPIAIFQAAKNNNYLGYARVAFDKNGILTHIFNKTIPTSTKIKENKEILSLIKQHSNLNPISYSLNDLNIDTINYSENALANFVTDTIKKQLNNADIVLLTSRMVRSDLKKGKISELTINEVLPDRNNKKIESFVILNLPGYKIKSLINSLNRLADSSLGRIMTHVSGLKYKINKNLESIDFEFINRNGLKEKLLSDKTYNVAIPGYLYNLKKFENLGLNQYHVVECSNKTAGDLVINYLKTNPGIIKANTDNRITFENRLDPLFEKFNLPNYVEIVI
ncbi:MAG: 5'-nucleotidase C-terminal domain-containing protein [Cyanobacteriota bacterium]